MKELEKLLDRIVQRVNINLRELDYDVSPFIKNLVPLNQMVKFYAFYGITAHHPLDFQFRHSSLAGSYFLGKIRTSNSILYKSDIRGDELKHRGDVFRYQKFEIPVSRDEGIDIEDSFLVKTLVHNYSHDPETLEKFFIKDTVSTHYANIHGSPSDGCFLGPFATVDLTTMRDCVIGTFSYVQAGEIGHLKYRISNHTKDVIYGQEFRIPGSSSDERHRHAHHGPEHEDGKGGDNHQQNTGRYTV